MLRLEEIPDWIINLTEDDLAFIKKFILSSGSLKDLAKEYDITYPTLRNRLDKLIEKIKVYEKSIDDPYIEKIKVLAIEDKIDIETAKALINEYRRSKKW